MPVNVQDYAAQAEHELTWRVDELRSLENLLSHFSEEEQDDNALVQACVVMLYAHFEGYCKFLLDLYVSAVNDAGITCSAADPAIAAASFSEVFKALRQPEKLCGIFKNVLPNDKKLHLFARERDFVESFQEFETLSVRIPDTFVDTESNLSAVVLKKHLYRLGLSLDIADGVSREISMLLSRRNDIAHGSRRRPIKRGEYDQLRDVVFETFQKMKSSIIESIRGRCYLRCGVDV